MNKKYEILLDDSQKVGLGHTVYRIKALRDFECGERKVKAGDLGGVYRARGQLVA